MFRAAVLIMLRNCYVEATCVLHLSEILTEKKMILLANEGSVFTVGKMKNVDTAYSHKPALSTI